MFYSKFPGKVSLHTGVVIRKLRYYVICKLTTKYVVRRCAVFLRGVAQYALTLCICIMFLVHTNTEGHYSRVVSGCPLKRTVLMHKNRLFEGAQSFYGMGCDNLELLLVVCVFAQVINRSIVKWNVVTT